MFHLPSIIAPAHSLSLSPTYIPLSHRFRLPPLPVRALERPGPKADPSHRNTSTPHRALRGTLVSSILRPTNPPNITFHAQVVVGRPVEIPPEVGEDFDPYCQVTTRARTHTYTPHTHSRPRAHTHTHTRARACACDLAQHIYNPPPHRRTRLLWIGCTGNISTRSLPSSFPHLSNPHNHCTIFIVSVPFLSKVERIFEKHKERLGYGECFLTLKDADTAGKKKTR